MAKIYITEEFMDMKIIEEIANKMRGLSEQERTVFWKELTKAIDEKLK